MDNDLQERLTAQDKKLEEIFISVEKTRKYFLWTIIVAVAVTVLPLIGIAFMLPGLINTYTTALGL